MTILAIISSTRHSTLNIDDAGYHIIRQIARHQPENQFILLLPDSIPTSLNNTPNIEWLMYKSSRWRFLERRNVRKKLKGIKADLCIALEDAVYLPPAIPAIRWVYGELNQAHKKWLSNPHIHWNLSLEPNTAWQSKFQIAQIPYKIYPPFVEWNETPYSETDKQAFKEKYTRGDDYVLFNFMGIKEEKSLVTLLKAYTQFKKWNKTGIKLLIGCTGLQENKILLLLQLYKFRSEVTILAVKDEKEWSDAIASAFLLADFTKEHTLTASMLRALDHGIPLIVKETNYFQSLMKDAVLYAKDDISAITSKLTLVYKDEQGNEERRRCYNQMGMRIAKFY